MIRQMIMLAAVFGLTMTQTGFLDSPANVERTSLQVAKGVFLDSQHRPLATPKFDYDEQYFLQLHVANYTHGPKSEIWVVEDLLMTDPSGQAVMTKYGIVERREIQNGDERGKPIVLTNSLKMSNRMLAGTYRVRIRVRDELNLETVVQDYRFSLGSSLVTQSAPHNDD